MGSKGRCAGKIGAKDALPARVEAAKFDPIRAAVEEAISPIRGENPVNPQ